MLTWTHAVFCALLLILIAVWFQGVQQANAAVSLEYAARFNDDDSAYLSRTPAGASNRKTWTWSAWVKRSAIGTSQGPLFSQGSDGNNYGSIWFYGPDKIAYMSASGGSWNIWVQSNALFRDPSGWDHIVVSTDTTQGTASDRIKIYVNGAQVTSLATATYPSQNYDTYFNSTGAHYIGRESFNGSYFDGYMSDVYFIDGQALTASSFGEHDTNGYWRPKSYTGTYGTNGFHLDFASGSDLGNDVSGNNNDWTANNLDATDQIIDTPTNTFSVFNPLSVSASGGTFSQGNTKFVKSGASFSQAYSSFGISSGKWYAEFTLTNNYQNGDVGFIYNLNTTGFAQEATNKYLGQGTATLDGVSYVPDGQTFIKDGTATDVGAGVDSAGDLFMLAVDADTGNLWWGKNCTWFRGTSGTPSALSGGDPTIASTAVYTGVPGSFYMAVDSELDRANWTANFGQLKYATSTATASTYHGSAGGYFYCTPPSGYKALSTANLPDVAIAKPANYFDAKTYTGTGSSQSVTGLGFQPDLVWLKDRTSANSHGIFDAVRTATKYLSSNSTAAETTDASSLTAFNAGGFSLGTTAAFNTSGNSYVSWNWKEGATSGFDVVTYSGNGVAGRTVSHDLGATPAFILLSDRGDVGAGGQDWKVYHQSLGATKWLILNSTAAAQTSNVAWYDTAPTNSVFTVSAHDDVNNASDTYVAYLFAEKEGFSKFGSYTGNGSTDGPFVYTGFKPKYVMIKKTSATEVWDIRDGSRSTYNPSAVRVYADQNVADVSTTAYVDLLSNGFKIRSTDGGNNTSSATYVYAAFAEIPFKYSALTGESPRTLTFTSPVYITGNATIMGSLSKGSGSFVIDHPLDPENKLLYHSFVESPDAMNIYTGSARLDHEGEAVINLPRYFLALNRDFTYQATPIGGAMPGLRLRKEAGRKFFGLFGEPVFRLAGGTPNGEVSWMVTGVRKDPYILANPIVPEVEKGRSAPYSQGMYVHPQLYEK